jgi:sulfur-carrier protein adenylyltransferase/sulfurtransferase
MSALGTVGEILELARWAPSGDNAQPWRFEIVSSRHIVVHGFDTRERCLYDIDGRPSQMALGALLETLALAASAHGLRAEVERRRNLPDTRPTFDVHLVPNAGTTPSDLIPAIRVRSVHRRPLRTRALRPEEKQALEATIGEGYSVCWLEGWDRKWRAARLMYANGKIRLTIPEAYAVHREIIEWGARFSDDRVPDRALGLDAVTLRLMRPVMASWDRVVFFNTYLGGTLTPRIQLDLIPSLACAAHFALLARSVPQTVDDYVAAGRAMQRFWLTATHLGLWLQPEMTPLIFSLYAAAGRSFTRIAPAGAKAHRVRGQLTELLGGQESAARAVFLARIGAGDAPKARSLRLPLERLMIRSQDSTPGDSPGATTGLTTNGSSRLP